MTNNLSFDRHIRKSQIAHIQLRNLKGIHKHLSINQLKFWCTDSLIHSHINFCNGLFSDTLLIRYIESSKQSCHNSLLVTYQVINLVFVCLFCYFTSQVNSYGHCGTVSSPNHTFSWAGLNKRVTSNSCTYFRL